MFMRYGMMLRFVVSLGLCLGVFWGLGSLALANGPSEPYISEVAPVAQPGSPAWVELIIPPSNTGYQIYLPLILKQTQATPIPQKAISQPKKALNSLAGWVISDEDGHTYTLPAELPAVPAGGIILIRLEAGIDDLDFSDGVATLYAANIPTDTFNSAGDQLALYRTATFTTANLVDFVAWGTAPGHDDDWAVEAELWTNGAYHVFDPGFGVGSADSPPNPNDSVGRWNGQWVSYRAGHSSPGASNGPPTPLGSTVSNGAILSAETFGVSWSGVNDDTARYQFQLATSPAFTEVVISATLDFPGWRSATPMPAGEYFWRAATIARDGSQSNFFGPYKIISDDDALSRAPQFTPLLTDDQYKIQRKDSTMLDIGGGSGNDSLSNRGSPRFGSRDRWDGPHVFSGGEPSFKWNGYDNFYCVRASVAMLNDYYGGNLYQDRISYYTFEEWASQPGAGLSTLGLNTPEDDMGFSRGIGIEVDQIQTLSWALNGADITLVRYCPQPSLEDDDPPYTCPNPEGGPITWQEITDLIDAGKPFMSINLRNAHARVVDGYRITLDLRQQVHILDPVPASCTTSDTSCDGRRWEDFTTFRNDNERIFYATSDNPTGRKNVGSLDKDSDGDGINNFDEWSRFNTYPYVRDTDGDGVNDKEDIAAYVFAIDETNYYKLPADWDKDSLRKEHDADNDNDLLIDGCEQSFINNFITSILLPCEPKFELVTPHTENPMNIGPRNNPNNFWAIATVGFPPAMPKNQLPTYQASNFSGRINRVDSGSVFQKGYNIINFAQVIGEKVGLKIKPPVADKTGKYSMYLTLNVPNIYNETVFNYQSLIYGPRQLGATNVLVGNGGNGGGGLSNFNALKAATQMYLSQWHPGDQVSLLSLGGQASLIVSPTTILTDARHLLPLRDSLEALTPVAADNDLAGAMNLLTPPTNPSDPYPKSLLALSGSLAPNSLNGDVNLDGEVNSSDFYTSTNPYSFTTIYPLALSQTGREPWLADALQKSGLVATPAIIRLADRPAPNQAQSVVNRTAAAFKNSAEQMLGETRLLTVIGNLSRQNSVTYSLHLSQATTIAFTANFSEPQRGQLSVFRPNGQALSTADADVQSTTYGHHSHFRVMNPVSGTWTLVLQSTDPAAPATEYIAFVSADIPETFGFLPGFQGKDQVGHLAPKAQLQPALHSGYKQIYSPLLDAGAYLSPTNQYQWGQLSAFLTTPASPSPNPINLLDDGQHGDGLAGDGLFGMAPFTPTVSGLYVLEATLSLTDNTGRVITRTASDAFVYRKPLAYIYGPESDPSTMLDYVDLLAEMGLPLSAVAQADLANTDWSQFDGLLIAADSHPLNQTWGTFLPSLSEALNNENLPIIGLGEGGYSLFADLNLSLGSNGPTATTGLSNTQAVNSNAAIWHTPYALSGSSPYTLYTESGGISLNLGTAPPANVDLIGLHPATAHSLITSEAGQYWLWGFQNGPATMTADGQRLFLNLLHHILSQ